MCSSDLIGTIADLIHYRSQNECMVERIAERPLRTAYGDFNMIAFKDKPSGSAHLALVHGAMKPGHESVVRVHQPVSILDLLETEATTHSWNVSSSLKAIKESEQGVMVLLNCGETAEQLFGQLEALTNEVRPSGRAASMDLRSYGIGAQILRAVGVCKMKLLASPRKMPSMTGFNLEVTGYMAKPAA